MQFKPILFYAISFFSGTALAQEKTTYVTDVSKVTILNPGFGYEKALGRNTTLYGRLFLITSGYFTFSDNFGTNYALYFDPALTVHYRYYYNALKRISKGKSTERNSLNYLAAIVVHIYSPQSGIAINGEDRYGQLYNKLGVAWGMQRNYNSRVSLDLNIGLGGWISSGTHTSYSGNYRAASAGVGLIGQLNVGFRLNKRNQL